MLPVYVEWETILGINDTSAEYKGVLTKLCVEVDTDADVITYSDGMTYHCFHKQGIAFAFMKNSDNALFLDSIDFYYPRKSASSIKEKTYAPVSPQFLPSWLKPDTTGKDLLEMFGEPEEKGGGITEQKINIWLRWNNFQVDLDDKNWETGQDSVWNSMTMFTEIPEK
ncbi:hypothetical protein NADFUDRAFT_53249 [Nadsonia fulvescens var. elongata DSM 6958]|uniref:Uncharacterized protein n=1 Tax=Nadsonia fulvescens var. elongata DSM 6958 TaxID=857566 RepID=A0A1E3PDV6_9ASCO|nr:hypothetical protein NADFUDRAFT_53249 [Nadsonia fulvescens var. elongata DSM 6958]